MIFKKYSLSAFIIVCLLITSPGNSRASDNFQFFAPPAEGALPNGPFGKLVRKGELIFTQTGKYAHQYVGNDLTCESCHLDRGIKPYSAPLWGAYGTYPRYRSKNHQVNTLEERMQGCFRFSLNGTPPPAGSETMKALLAYSFWVSRGAPVGLYLKGQGILRMSKPANEPSPLRGKKVFESRCSLCHGLDGLGTQADNDQVAFPPVWGPRSFNKGAGFHNVKELAGFLKMNMPLSKGETLSDQEAWDVASYIVSKPRPEDPRKLARTGRE
jgi:thiosulfate dehydrogenase